MRQNIMPPRKVGIRWPKVHHWFKDFGKAFKGIHPWKAIKVLLGIGLLLLCIPFIMAIAKVIWVAGWGADSLASDLYNSSESVPWKDSSVTAVSSSKIAVAEIPPLDADDVKKRLYLHGAALNGWGWTDLSPRVQYRLTHEKDLPWEYTGIYLGGLKGARFQPEWTHSESGYQLYYKCLDDQSQHLLDSGTPLDITGNSGALYLKGRIFLSGWPEVTTTVSFAYTPPKGVIVLPTWKVIPGGTASPWTELPPQKGGLWMQVYVRFSQANGQPILEQSFLNPAGHGRIRIGQEEIPVLQAETVIDTVTVEGDPETLVIQTPHIGTDASGQPLKVFCQVNVVVPKQPVL